MLCLRPREISTFYGPTVATASERIRICRALQSHAQKLGEQVSSMSAKIKELESALAAAHLQLQATPEEPEDTDTRDPKKHGTSRQRMYGDSAGSLAIDPNGIAVYFGDTAASEV